MEFGIWNLDLKFHQKQVTRRNILIYLHLISLILSLQFENLKQAIGFLLANKRNRIDPPRVYLFSLCQIDYTIILVSLFSQLILPRIFLWTHLASLVLKIGGEEISLSLASSISHSLFGLISLSNHFPFFFLLLS